MRHWYVSVVVLGIFAARAHGQEFLVSGPTSAGSEPLYSYDDPEVWKHGWLQIMPYYGGHHTFRPYNYKQVISQSAQAAAWGMPPTMPYSQQYYHRYENLPAGEIPALSDIQPAPYGPHPSAFHQPQWDALQHSPTARTGFNPRAGAAFPQSVGWVDFERIHRSPAAGPEIERRDLHAAQIQQLLREAQSTAHTSVPLEPISAPAAQSE
jgi:hypothetical protein